MKLTDIVVEGYRFGAKERKIVDKYANKIKVGFEAEYMYSFNVVNETNILDIWEEQDPTEVPLHELTKFVNKEFPTTTGFVAILNLLDGEEPEAKEWRDLEESLKMIMSDPVVFDLIVSTNSMEAEDDVFKKYLEMFIDTYMKYGIEGFKNPVFLETLKPLKEEIQELFGVKTSATKTTFSRWFRRLKSTTLAEVVDYLERNGFTRLVENFYYANGTILDSFEIDIDAVDDYVYKGIYTMLEKEDKLYDNPIIVKRSDVSGYVENLEDYIDKSDMRTNDELADNLEQELDCIVDDEERTNQRECVTYPEPFKDSLRTLRKMFDTFSYHVTEGGDYPDEYYIDGGCGLHINMSIENKRFNRKDLNPLKLYLFMNEAFITRGDKSKDILGFNAREYVEQISSVLYKDLYIADVVREYINQTKLDTRSSVVNRPANILKDYKTLAHIAEQVFLQIVGNTKYIQINFQHLQYHKTDDSRIEFRFPGGRDYHLRYDEVKDYMYRMAYMLMASIDSKSGYKEYMSYLIKFLDEQAMVRYDSTFAELVINQLKLRGDI